MMVQNDGRVGNAEQALLASLPEPHGVSALPGNDPSRRTLKESLARYMDPQAFEPVPARIKFTCGEAGRVAHDKRKVRREIALKRAASSIRFFMKPDNLKALQTRIAIEAEQSA